MRHTFRYVVAAAGARREITLDPPDAHHLARVVRRRPGDPVQLIDGSGTLWPAVVVSLDPVVVRVGDDPCPSPRRLPVRLAVGLADWSRLDLVVEKATELGVPRITFVSSDRAGRVPDADAFARRRLRMLRVAESAARQSGHATLPGLTGIVPFAEVLGAGLPTFLVHPGAEQGLAQAVVDAAPTEALVVVGPDAGFSASEVAAAVAAGATLACLGDAILRTETAAIVAVGVTAAVMGALGPPADHESPGTG